ncbi:hypothetical protein [uncultured Sphingomonas sp.]|uniref:hypothetical protein n=1 Tax=uncultured Sphingomonas sp. TaxID=158754 RepID=UPI002586E272|nr:hypothetical protein [uncultured Sphingomonas sp.]
MRRLVRIHIAAAILTGLAIAALLYGRTNIAVAILCFLSLGQLAAAEIVRVTIAPFARKEDR